MGSSKPQAMNNEVKTSLLVRKRVAPFWVRFLNLLLIIISQRNLFIEIESLFKRLLKI
jgi:hypothetical protein